MALVESFPANAPRSPGFRRISRDSFSVSWSAPSGVPRNPRCARGALVLSSPGRGARGKGPHLEVVLDAVALADLLEPPNSGVALAELLGRSR